MRESLKIYDYIRSSAAYRVRIALNLKGLRYEQVSINLLEGEQRSAEYEAINPQRLVPALESEAGILTQSLAIIEYLDERYTDRPLLSDDAWQRARQRALSQVIACDIHPLNNFRVLNYLRGPLGQTEEAVHQWMANWISAGFSTLEQSASGTRFLGGDQPMLPDIVLVPQMFNARRFNVPLDDFPGLVEIAEQCNDLQAFQRAAPDSVL